MLLAFPLLLEDQTPENDVHVTVSFQVSPLILNLDYPALDRLLAIMNVLINMKKVNYNDTIMNYLSEAPSAGFFTVSSSSVFGNYAHEKQEDIYSILGEYLNSTVTPSAVTPVSAPTATTIQRHNSVNSDYQSVNSEGHESFHSIIENPDTTFVDDDFQSINDSSSIVSGRDGRSETNSFSSISGDQPISPTPNLLHPPVVRRRNSVFSITSATHSQAQTARRHRDYFVSLGGNNNEKSGDDYQTIVESELNDSLSISSLSSKKRRMNLNVCAMMIL